MTYIDLINHFWKVSKENAISGVEAHLYYKLLDTCNCLNWKNPFTHANNFICGELGVSEKTLRTARQNLKRYGLIDFKSGKQKKQMTEYSIIGVSSESPNYRRKDKDKGTQTGTQTGTPKGTQKGTRKDTPAGTHKGTQTGTPTGEKAPDILRGRDREEIDSDKKNDFKEPDGSSSSCDDPEVSVNYIFNQYNSICKNVTRAKALSEARRKMIGARLREHGFKAVMEMLDMASKSDFMSGANKRSWVANIDWMFKPTNFVKVLDGVYNNRPSGSTTDNFYARPSNLEIIEETYNNLMADERYNSCR